ncbi:MAG TPA: SRPBCC family protein [Oligoflexus sp.]|uniref:SRPBCC family protein n=1 Tax=Oligoflexus sp. TaxID=1971216 RepID=UPI002D805C69|nr:SRPBCC family protein [Oligoflexus sp.]HET9237325.1 SRPBCC family protein [Oligoflexus sp.]
MTQRIQRTIDIKAPLSRVWKALTDSREFGQWFRAKIDQPFRIGETSTGFMAYPGYEHLKWEAKVLKMEPEKLFSFLWPPYTENASVDLSQEPWQLVEFRLEEIPGGTRLTVTESGFEKLSPAIRDDARRGNEQGWDIQMKNVLDYVTQNP